MKTQPYKRIVVYYFSGTGNAKNTANWISDEAKKLELEVDVFNIAKIRNQNIQEPDSNSLIGFISPTHGFHFPEITRKFIKRFPKSTNCSVFVMNTRAGLRIGKVFMPGISGVLHYWSSITLMRKGFKIVGLLPVDLPSNWLSFHPTVRKKGIELIYQHVEPKVRRFAIKILDGKTSYRALYDIIQDIIVSPISAGYIFAGKYFFAKSFIASSDCDNCDICEKACPVQAIKEVNGRKYWTSKCESCMKCMNVCPQKAIETAHGFIILIWIISSFVIGYLFNLIAKYFTFTDWQWLQNESVIRLTKFILIFPILFFGYRVMHWLMQFKLIERFFVLTSLTKYKFWGRYKSPKKPAKV